MSLALEKKNQVYAYRRYTAEPVPRDSLSLRRNVKIKRNKKHNPTVVYYLVLHSFCIATRVISTRTMNAARTRVDISDMTNTHSIGRFDTDWYILYLWNIRFEVHEYDLIPKNEYDLNSHLSVSFFSTFPAGRRHRGQPPGTARTQRESLWTTSDKHVVDVIVYTETRIRDRLLLRFRQNFNYSNRVSTIYGADGVRCDIMSYNILIYTPRGSQFRFEWNSPKVSRRRGRNSISVDTTL